MKTWIKNNIFTTILIMAIIAFLASWGLMAKYANTETLPLGYFQKAIFAIIFASVVSIIWPLFMKITNPKAHDEIDELTDGGINDLPSWERTKIYMWKASIFIALVIAGIMS